MAFDIGYQKQNDLNLTRDTDIGRRVNDPAKDAKVALDAFSKRLAAMNVSITNFYKANASSPGVKSLANRFVPWRDKAYGYIRAWKPSLAKRFAIETPPKEKQLIEFYKEFLKLSGAHRKVTTQPVTPTVTSPADAAKAVFAASPTSKAPPPKIRTPRAKAASRAPLPSPTTASAPLPEPLPPQEEGPGKMLLIGGAALALATGAYFVTRTSGPAARRGAGARA